MRLGDADLAALRREGKSQAEIARLVGVSRARIGQRLQRFTERTGEKFTRTERSVFRRPSPRPPTQPLLIAGLQAAIQIKEGERDADIGRRDKNERWAVESPEYATEFQFAAKAFANRASQAQKAIDEWSARLGKLHADSLDTADAS